jgi:CRISPR-associated endoribonuclease Cas6
VRIAISFVPKDEKPLVLSVHYNEKVQGMIYHNLSESLANWLHGEGYQREKRRFRLFTFSRLQGKYRVKNGEITFSGPVRFLMSSPNKDILESFATHLVRQGEIALGRNRCELISVEVLMNQPLTPPVRVKTLSIFSRIIAKNYYGEDLPTFRKGNLRL